MFSVFLKYDILNRTYNRIKRMVNMTKNWKKLLMLVMLLGITITPLSVYAEEQQTETGTQEEEKEPTTSTDNTETEKPSDPTPTPTPEVTIKPRLQSLTVEGFNLNEAFDPEKTNYSLTVPASTTKITVKAVAAEGCTVFEGAKSYDLEEGKTKQITVKAKVKGDDESPLQAYTISVTRPTETVNLKSLMVSGYSFNETFSQNNYSYTMTVPYDVTELNISAVAENSTDSVEISGADSLIVGENRVTITVRSESGKEAKYEILVTREEESEDINHSSNSTSQMIVEEKSDNSLLKYILLTIGCVVLIAIAAVGIIFYMKSASPEKKAAKEARKQAKKENKNNSSDKNFEKNEDRPSETQEEPKLEETEILDNEEETKEAPTIKSAKDDILEGMDDILDDKD